MSKDKLIESLQKSVTDLTKTVSSLDAALKTHAEINLILKERNKELQALIDLYEQRDNLKQTA